MPWEKFRLHTRLRLSAAHSEQVYARIATIDAVKQSWQLIEQYKAASPMAVGKKQGPCV